MSAQEKKMPDSELLSVTQADRDERDLVDELTAWATLLATYTVKPGAEAFYGRPLRDLLNDAATAIRTRSNTRPEAIAADRLARTQAGGDPLRDALQAIVSGASDTYRKRNGHIGSIEADDGEKCWIVHSDLIFDAERALATPTSSVEVEREACAKVADRIAAARRHAQRGNFGNRTCADEAEGASAVAAAIRSRPLPSDRGEVEETPVLLLTKQATELVALRGEVERLRGALRFYADLANPRAWLHPVEVDAQWGHNHNHRPTGEVLPSEALLADRGELARTALSTEGGEHG